jgi:uncharacterized protein
MIILHLISMAEWQAFDSTGIYEPASLEAEGFVHCTDDIATLLGVANRFYRSVAGDVLVLELDVAALGALVLWEAPAHIDGSAATDSEPRFPHVYGPIPLAAVVGITRFVRSPAGEYLGVSGFDGFDQTERHRGTGADA